MDFLSALVHLGNFFAPALALPLLLWWPARWAFGTRGRVVRFWLHWPMHSAVCAVVLVAGLLIFGRDGKMATYAAMVLCCASCQWLTLQGWRS